jgi:hypothetical protein
MPSKTISQWTKSHGYSRGFWYILKKKKKAPRTFRALSTERISDEADAEWVREREAETAASNAAQAPAPLDGAA